MKLDAQQNGWYEKYQEAEQLNPDDWRKMFKAFKQESSSLGRGKRRPLFDIGRYQETQ